MSFFRAIWAFILSLFQPKPIQIDLPPSLPFWFVLAEKEIGVKEVVNGENPRIIEYHMATSLKASTDEIPWCASFICWVMEQSGIKSTRSAWAKEYLNWGTKLDTPKPGCVVVFKRGTNSGHVALFVSEDESSVLVLGGNQSNMVCIAEYSKENLLGYRWPNGYQ